ncbi:MAG TPA: D-arabinono-1,4-lactone oxidase [Steroidobacteraceae bacterium]|jgi:FAD-linked oxidoreductase
MSKAENWKNWSGSVQAQPSRLASPRTEDELATIVRGAAKVRVVGAGHSFMPLCATPGVLLSLAELDSPIEVDADGASAWVPAGWSLKRLTAALWERGYSLLNQGDINPQSLAGAMGTGTHGTGAELGSLSTFARGFRLMLADGSIVECSKEQRPELFEAQRLSLGLLGVATRIRVTLMPAYHLEERIERVPIAAAIEHFEEVARTHRHAEFFVFPYADEVIMKTLHPAAEAGAFKEPSSSDETIFRFCCDVTAAAPAVARVLQRQLMRLIRSSRRTGPAYRIFPSERTVSFEEMEYEMPRAAGLGTLQEAIAWVRKRKLPVAFPFEFRWVAADDIWLSPFNDGPGASISMHQYSKMQWRDLLAAAEPIFRGNGGRPHWAKRHTLTSKDVFALYPLAERFCKVRAQVDPAAKFANAHLAELFGIGT